MGDVAGVTPISALIDDVRNDRVSPFLKPVSLGMPLCLDEPLYRGQPLGEGEQGARVLY